MQDLTTGSVSRHLLKTAGFMLATMVFQTLYFLVDLYWVGRLGTAAVAAVGIAGNVSFLVLALTQMLGVGTTTVVSHAVGRKDHAQALLLFNQSQVLAMVTGIVFLIVGLASMSRYVAAMSADAATAEQAIQYLTWFIPAMALQFALVAMGSALRAIGNFRPGMIVSSSTVLLNMVLAPFLIFGWGTGKAFGVAGAAIATLISVVVAMVWFSTYFIGKDKYLHLTFADWRPRFDTWKKMLAIGMPTGFEFAITSVYLLVVYSITRPFGAAAQAGFGIGMRVIQAGFMPVVALGFSVAPVAGQNFGAKHRQRVIDTFKDAAWMSVGAMVLLALVVHIAPAALIGVFSKDPAVIAVGTEYLKIVSFTFIASGLIFVNSSMFQAMGNTIPSLVTSVARITIVAIPAFFMATMPGFQLRWLWYLSLFAVAVQLALSLWLLRREFRRRLNFDAGATSVPAPAV